MPHSETMRAATTSITQCLQEGREQLADGASATSKLYMPQDQDSIMSKVSVAVQRRNSKSIIDCQALLLWKVLSAPGQEQLSLNVSS